ncbi:DUF2946 domain-containing protein [Acinetobacter sp. WZC-1]|uniref:DUF2946 domain-containing protein n=1 Tax=Acinetobacter sp. WZC-1 TaxID=3459034 RepID=UPI00403D605F
MNVLLFRTGLLLGFSAVFLQIAVFLQPLLPERYQIAPVCETISQALTQLQPTVHQHASSHDHSHTQHMQHSALFQGHTAQADSASDRAHDSALGSAHHHDVDHQCQYCTVYGNLVLPPELSIKPVLDRIQVRLIAFQKACLHVYFVLQRLFLLPQGRAPPVLI